MYQTQVRLMLVQFRKEYTFPGFNAYKQLSDMQGAAKAITQLKCHIRTCLAMSVDKRGCLFAEIFNCCSIRLCIIYDEKPFSCFVLLLSSKTKRMVTLGLKILMSIFYIGVRFKAHDNLCYDSS